MWFKKESFENRYRRMCRTGEIAHYDLRAFSRPDDTVDHGKVTDIYDPDAEKYAIPAGNTEGEE